MTFNDEVRALARRNGHAVGDAEELLKAGVPAAEIHNAMLATQRLRRYGDGSGLTPPRIVALVRNAIGARR